MNFKKILLFFILVILVSSINAQSFNVLLKKAKQGDMKAQEKLAYKYYFGEGIKQNKEKALYWYRWSAKNGYPYAQTIMGAFYENGQILDKNINKAIKWFKKAAMQGDLMAVKFLLNYETFKLANISEIKKNMEEEIKNLRNSEIFKDKSEFETKKMYKDRIAKAKKKLKKLKSKFGMKMKKEIEKCYVLKKKKIKNSIEKVVLEVEDIGRYKAENQVFPITFKGVTMKVHVPINEAKSFKENIDKTKVIAYKKLKDNLESYKYYDCEIKHPVTGNIFYFGDKNE